MHTHTLGWNANSLAALVIISLLGLATAKGGIDYGNSSNKFEGLSDKLLIGEIYPIGSDRQNLLFHFRRTAERTGNDINVTRTYTYPNGRTAAVEKVTYRDRGLISYELFEKQIGAHGKAVIQGNAETGTGKISLEYVKDGETHTGEEELVGRTVVNDNIVPYLLAHFDQLMQGEEVPLQYIVVPRTRTVGFNLVKSGDATWQGRPAVIIKMIPSNFFIRLVVDPIYFTVDNDSRQVVKYEGRTTPKIKEDGEWKDLDGVMVFPPAPAS